MHETMQMLRNSLWGYLALYLVVRWRSVQILLCCLSSCRKGEFAVSSVPDVLDIGLCHKGAQFVVHGATLDAQFFAFHGGLGGGEGVGHHMQEGKGADVGSRGLLLLLLTAQTVVEGRGLHHTIEDIGEAPLEVGLRDGEALLCKHALYAAQLLVAAQHGDDHQHTVEVEARAQYRSTQVTIGLGECDEAYHLLVIPI